MTRTNSIALLKRALTPFLAVSLAIALLALYESKTSSRKPEQGQSAAASHYDMTGKKEPYENGEDPSGTSPDHASAANDHVAGVTVVILDSGKELPFEFKLGGQYIKVPGPSSWPPIDKDGAAGSQKDRYLAAIIDTADVLQANGFKPDDAFSFVVGGTELNAGNTFRVKGNHQPADAKGGGDLAVEYRTQAGEQGIWRSLKFKNIVLSHAQVPSLEDHLVLPQTGDVAHNEAASHGTVINAEKNLHPEAPNAANTAQVSPLEEPTPASARKYVEALNSPDPAVRADAIQNLMMNGYREANVNDGNVKMDPIVAKTLTDSDPAVRAAVLDSLDGYEGNVPQGTLSHMALNDSNPALRIHALDLLVERFGEQATATLKEARHDPDPRVGRMANQLLNEFANKPQQ